MAVNHQIASIIANGYNRLAEIGLEIIRNYDDGYGLSEKQDELRKRLIKGTKTLRLISKFVEFNDDGDYVAVHRLTDAHINDLLKYLVKVLDIKGLPVAPKIFYRGYPYIRTQGGPGAQGEQGIQGPAGGGTPFSSLSFNDATNIVDRFGITDDISCKWEYQLYGSLGRRRGTIKAIWSDDGLTISSPEEDSTDDIGATIDNVTFTVEKDGDDIVLVANVDSGTWNVRGLRYFDRNNATLPTSGYLPNGQIYVGNASDEPIARTPGGVVAMTNGGVFSFVADSIVNADVNASAAIAYSKLNLSASIVNADIASGAAIAYSKLNLSGSIVNADIASGAAIARSKIATGTAYRFIVNSSTGALAEVAVTANRAVVADANGLPTASDTTATEIGYVNGVTSPIQAQFAGKQNTITGAASTATTSNFAANRLVITDASGKLTVSSGSSGAGVPGGATNELQKNGGGVFDGTGLFSSVDGTLSAAATITIESTGASIRLEPNGRALVFEASSAGGSNGTIIISPDNSFDAVQLQTNDELGANSRPVTIRTGHSQSGFDSAAVTIETGNVTTGAGDSGDIVLSTGSVISGARGILRTDSSFYAGAGISTESASGPFLKTVVVEIGDWDMDLSAQAIVAHGLGANFSKIRLVTAEIINDAGTATYTLISCFTNAGLSSNVTGAIESKDSTNISLTRVQGGFFDSTDFNSTGYNRGWVTIIYEA